MTRRTATLHKQDGGVVYELEVDQAQRVGSATVGGPHVPIYLDAGLPAPCDGMLDISSAQHVTGAKLFDHLEASHDGERVAPLGVRALNIDRDSIPAVGVSERSPGFAFKDAHGLDLVAFYIQYRNGQPALYCRSFNADGVIVADKHLMDLGA